jgi:hypothetical protein
LIISNCLQSDILSYCDVCTLHVLDELMDTVGDRTTYKDIKFVTRAWHHGSGSALPQRNLFLFLFAFHFEYNFSFRLELYLEWTFILNCFSFRISNEKNNFIWVCKWYLHLLLH